MRVCARIGAVMAVAASLAAPFAHAEPWASKVNAVYKVSLSGFDLGSFQFQSSTSGQSYTLAGVGDLSAAFGAWRWHGQIQSSGTIVGEQPRPAGYTYDWRGGKNGSVKIAFDEAGVSNVAIQPSSPPSPGTIPVREHHLKNVLDPMTAVMALSRASGGNPCGRRISIFDGKQRFDLVLSFRRQERVVEAQPSGQPSIAYVCRVQYIPVAGHKNNPETRQMASTSAIEVAFRPIPSLRLLVPYQITIPTIVGSAVMTSERVEITAPGNRRIAIVH
jgi:hypothetical protein